MSFFFCNFYHVDTAGAHMTRKSTFIFIYTNWKLITEKSKWLTGIQLSMFHMIMGFSAWFSKI